MGIIFNRMEQWEVDLRKKLNAELKEGAYDISNLDFKCVTGKQGYIEFEVALRKPIDIRYANGNGIMQQIKNVDNAAYGTLSIDKLDEDIKKLFK
jgi:hypothetical protein